MPGLNRRARVKAHRSSLQALQSEALVRHAALWPRKRG
jgi:hypothetical protein